MLLDQDQYLLRKQMQANNICKNREKAELLGILPIYIDK